MKFFKYAEILQPKVPLKPMTPPPMPKMPENPTAYMKSVSTLANSGPSLNKLNLNSSPSGFGGGTRLFDFARNANYKLESAFNPFAINKGSGAFGLNQ